MATRGHLGALPATGDAAVVLTPRRDVVIIETVGVGQDSGDRAERRRVDRPPGLGDD
jgi:putative protein kinase ArgK-like GTPase of G3E family